MAKAVTLKNKSGEEVYPVTDASLVNGSLGQSQIASNAITAAKIVDGAVTAAKIANGAVTKDKLDSTTITPIYLHVVGNWGNYASFFQIVTDCPWEDINSAAKLANYLWTHGHSTDGYARIPVTGNNPTKGGASVALYAATSSTLKDSVGDYTFQNMHLMSIRLL